MPHSDTAAPEIEVAVYLIGDFHPDEIAPSLGVVPNVVLPKGSERRRKSTGEVLGIYDESTWGFSSAQAVASNELSEHVAWVIRNGGPVKALANERIQVFIEVTLDGGTSCVLPKSLLVFAQELRAEVGIVARGRRAA
jgi:hypothetical protein